MLIILMIAAAFGFTPVGLTEYVVALLLALLVIPVVELVKLIRQPGAGKAQRDEGGPGGAYKSSLRSRPYPLLLRLTSRFYSCFCF